MRDADALMLAIRDDNRFLHVGPGGIALAHLREEETGVPLDYGEGARDPFDFFDGDGVRWLREPPGTGLRLVPADAEVTPPRFLLDRIDAVLAHMQVVLNETPGFGSVPGPPMVRVPRPEGTLPEVMVRLDELFRGLRPPQPDKGSFFHMLAHLAGTAHT
ncbi:hypothetical protein ACTI_53160 [Actinoplanes sp. OR16]|uniref:hypothetical protein n=1 Tax=Actinoplanes sp. OR16 TaxID=946334 RepID=UPI000F6E15A8|nr:hypothetical protein [Actinoplanes sp. OR16]BBH68631.1 hypothetical protein ACTI_53160 [Actinoplanes sp. OR16]